jgi:hypothetical protein
LAIGLLQLPGRTERVHARLHRGVHLDRCRFLRGRWMAYCNDRWRTMTTAR